MRLLVLGGTRFVGRAVVADALERGWDVTALHRGVTGALPEAVERLTADRTDRGELAAALGDRRFDAVVDTWAQAPRVVRDAVEVVDADRYAYISSLSVYVWGRHVDESSPVVDGDPDAEMTDYAADKRGAELAVLARHPEALLARAGLILGPHEDIGRLPWWLDRVRRGGRVVAPGRPDRPLQYVDARDLAGWVLDSLAEGRSGAFDGCSRSGHTTTRGLLDACIAATGSDAELVWFSEDELAEAGAEPWTHLPCWVPETGEFEGFLEGDTSKIAAAGLRCRPVEETVRDTWAALQVERPPPPRAGVAAHGLPAEIEQRLLHSRP